MKDDDRLKIVHYEPWHTKLAKPGKHFKHHGLHPEIQAWARRQMEGVTLLVDGEIAVILGVVPLWGKVYEVTMLPTDKFYTCVKLCLRYIKKILALSFDTLGIERLQATAFADCPSHQRFLEGLGFSEKHFAKKCSPDGEDMYHYAIVRE